MLASLDPTAEAEPWSQAASHQLLVDGEPAFPTELPLIDLAGEPSPLTVRVFAFCLPDQMSGGDIFARGVELMLSTGPHRLTWL